MKKRTKKRMKLSTRRAWFGALCVSPFILGFLTMTMSPILLYIVIGFHKVMSGDNGIALISVGWQNYIDLFYTEVDFLENVASSLGNMFLNGLFIVIFSLLIATVLNQRFRGRGFARAVLFLPVVIASGVAAMCMNDSLVDSAWAALMTVASSDSLDPERFNPDRRISEYGRAFFWRVVFPAFERSDRTVLYYCPVFGGADPDFSGRVADNLPLVIRGRQYRRRDRLGELLANHFPDDQPYDSGQRGLHRHRSA